MSDNATTPPTADGDEQPQPRAVPIARIMHLLNEGEIAAMEGVMLWGSNYAGLVTVEDDELVANAVYKPQRGERPLWDFPDGTLCHREVAAFQISEALNWGLVPPTVLREGPHGLGSVQLFIDHDPEINYFVLDNRFEPQLQRFTIFDHLVNNADRKGGHLLLDARGKLWGIDHGLTFHTQSKLRTVIWEFAGEAIDEALLAPVRHLQAQLAERTSPLYQQLCALISETEIHALQRRTNQLLDQQRFPQPGPGPNHPWPPI